MMFSWLGHTLADGSPPASSWCIWVILNSYIIDQIYQLYNVLRSHCNNIKWYNIWIQENKFMFRSNKFKKGINFVKKLLMHVKVYLVNHLPILPTVLATVFTFFCQIQITPSTMLPLLEVLEPRHHPPHHL
jgi:uncharacterized membrane protein